MLPSSTSPIHEKRSKFSIAPHMPTSPLNSLNYQSPPTVSPPMIPMQAPNQCSSMHGFMPRPNMAHPAFPFMPPPVESMFAGRKMHPHFNDFWKNKTNYLYNPFNVLWAKKMGFYNDHQHNQNLPAITHPSMEFQHKNELANNGVMKNKEPSLDMHWNNPLLTSDFMGQKAAAATSAHYSAFKPVSRLPFEHLASEKASSADMWSPAKDLVSPVLEHHSEESNSSPLLESDDAPVEYTVRETGSVGNGSDVVETNEHEDDQVLYTECVKYYTMCIVYIIMLMTFYQSEFQIDVTEVGDDFKDPPTYTSARSPSPFLTSTNTTTENILSPMFNQEERIATSTREDVSLSIPVHVHPPIHTVHTRTHTNGLYRILSFNDRIPYYTMIITLMYLILFASITMNCIYTDSLLLIQCLYSIIIYSSCHIV